MINPAIRQTTTDDRSRAVRARLSLRGWASSTVTVITQRCDHDHSLNWLKGLHWKMTYCKAWKAAVMYAHSSHVAETVAQTSGETYAVQPCVPGGFRTAPFEKNRDHRFIPEHGEKGLGGCDLLMLRIAGDDHGIESVISLPRSQPARDISRIPLLMRASGSTRNSSNTRF